MYPLSPAHKILNAKIVKNGLTPQFNIKWLYSLFTCFQQWLSNVCIVFRNKSQNMLDKVFKMLSFYLPEWKNYQPSNCFNIVVIFFYLPMVKSIRHWLVAGDNFRPCCKSWSSNLSTFEINQRVFPSIDVLPHLGWCWRAPLCACWRTPCRRTGACDASTAAASCQGPVLGLLWRALWPGGSRPLPPCWRTPWPASPAPAPATVECTSRLLREFPLARHFIRNGIMKEPTLHPPPPPPLHTHTHKPLTTDNRAAWEESSPIVLWGVQ